MKNISSFQESLFTAGDILAQSIITGDTLVTKWQECSHLLFCEAEVEEKKTFQLSVSKNGKAMYQDNLAGCIFRDETSKRLAEHLLKMYGKEKRDALVKKIAQAQAELDEIDGNK